MKKVLRMTGGGSFLCREDRPIPIVEITGILRSPYLCHCSWKQVWLLPTQKDRRMSGAALQILSMESTKSFLVGVKYSSPVIVPPFCSI